MPLTTDPRILNLAGFISPIHPMSNTNGSVTIAWYDPSGGGAQRAYVFLDAPGYVGPGSETAITKSRDFLYTFLTGTQRLGATTHPAAMAAWTNFNAKLSAYQTAVADFTASGANGGRWIAPFPQTIASLWRDVVTNYVNAWLQTRTVANAILGATSGGNAATAAVPPAPTNSTPTATTTFASKVSAAMTSMSPETMAQVVGTQVRAVSPTSSLSAGTSTSPAASASNGAQVAQSMSTAAGAPLVVPQVPALPLGAPTVHTPLYANPMFWLAIGGAVAAGGIAYFLVKK